MPQLLGLIFDLDGTLVDSAADIRQAINTLMAAHNRRALTLEEVKSMTGDGLRTQMLRAFAATGESLAEASEAAVMRDFVTAYQNQKASPDMLYVGAMETITSFRASGVKIGLCTNKLYLPTLRLLDDIGMTELFDFIAGGDTFPVYKPHAGHVLGVAAGLKVPPSACVMIGDSVNDIAAAKAACVTNIAVSHGYGANVASLGADAVISGLKELSEVLKRLGFTFLN